MVPIFKYGHCTETSAAVESTFKDLKHVTFKHIQLPTRIDNFVRKHIDANVGDAILQKSDNDHSPEMNDRASEFSESPNNRISHEEEKEGTLDPNSDLVGSDENSQKPIESQLEIPVNSQSIAENEPFSIEESNIYTELNSNNPKENETSEVPISSESVVENGNSVIERSNLNIHSNNNSPAESKADIPVTSENAVENWRNLNRVPRQRRKTHFDKGGTLRTINFNSKSLSPVIGLLKMEIHHLCHLLELKIDTIHF